VRFLIDENLSSSLVGALRATTAAVLELVLSRRTRILAFGEEADTSLLVLP